MALLFFAIYKKHFLRNNAIYKKHFISLWLMLFKDK